MKKNFTIELVKRTFLACVALVAMYIYELDELVSKDERIVSLGFGVFILLILFVRVVRMRHTEWE